MSRPYSIHSLDGGRVLVVVGLTLTPALRDRLIDVALDALRIEQIRLDDGHGMTVVPAIRIQRTELWNETHTKELPRVRDGRLSEADEIEIRSLLAAHAAEVIS